MSHALYTLSTSAAKLGPNKGACMSDLESSPMSLSTKCNKCCATFTGANCEWSSTNDGFLFKKPESKFVVTFLRAS